MKKLLLIAVLLLSLVSCKKDNTTANQNIDPFIADNYTEDARQLLFRMLQNGSVVTDKNKPEFNQTELDKILHSLQAVYNLKTRQTDSIFFISKVHVFPYVSLQSVILQVNQSTLEGKKLMNYQASGNTAFDNLMSQYGFTFYGNTVNLPNYGFVAIKAPRSYNLVPLLEAFKKFSFVIDAQNNNTLGDGNDITYTINTTNSSVAHIDFAVKSGDCPAGCTLKHGWRYDVFYQNNSYKALYLGSY